ncbi:MULTISPECIES: TIGR01777 family oxidoreductase [unclassified Streptomyces]|uniref:TIGR01777 family oxidoreductase n=1 Tax=unclassified Streptomyces TaxID=2593676 RepID=UPI0022B7465D|nr:MULTISPECIES: TIGR01777 family oxidoreductase [unclassified Streptomyces]MCZ7413811.1 TIGR01777 family oxidoreductase [Streptomyces sp. WMMC897]MCZ7430807.1 TIGR01777 family oxidoreductase [Streptomyces sp. WMMC1477]
MRVVITGAGGLIGTALTRSLRGDGHEVVRLVRRAPTAADEARWDPERGTVDRAGLLGADAVVHLAGAGVGDRRWTAAYKRLIRDSRVRGTATLAEALASLEQPPRVLLSASGISYYGDTGSQAVDETAPSGDGFLASVCRDWEAAAEPARRAGVRTVFTRTGLVVSGDGGAWGRRLMPLFRAGLGGRVSHGRQYWSCVSLHDHVAALRHLLDHPDLDGPVNVTGPNPVTNREVTAAMGRVLRRPTLFTAPAPALRLALGDFAEELLASTRVLPSRLLASGFTFAHPTTEDAVRAAATASRS